VEKFIHVNDPLAGFTSFDWVSGGETVDYGARQQAGQFDYFVRHVIDVRDPASYQLDIGNSLIKNHRVAVHGPHGIGKTALSSWVILYFLWAFPHDLKIITTASTWLQLTKYLWPEINRWGRKVDWESQGLKLRVGKELLLRHISIPSEDKYVISASPSHYTNIEGAHASTLLYVFDEAKVIDIAVWDAAEGAFSTGDAYALAISTPGDTSGRFYQICNHQRGYEDWATRHVTKEEAIEAGRMSEKWADQRRRQWEHTRPDLYFNRVLGEFYETSERTLIPSSWVRLANQRYYELLESGELGKMRKAVTAYGADIAEEGGDRTVLAEIVNGNVLLRLIVRELDLIKAQTLDDRELIESEGNPLATAKWISKYVGNVNKSVPIAVDGIGVGAGVAPKLRELGHQHVRNVKVSRSKDVPLSRDKNEFSSLRGYLWWFMREALDPEGDIKLALPEDDQLFQELTAPDYTPDNRGRLIITPKDDMKKQLDEGRSPDKAEALMMALWAGSRRNKRLIAI
jgi:hypothetical protein